MVRLKFKQKRSGDEETMTQTPTRKGTDMTPQTNEPSTGAEWMAAERLQGSVDYAVGQLKSGKFLVLTNDPDGRLIGNAGLDPRAGREWLTAHCESPVRAWT